MIKYVGIKGLILKKQNKTKKQHDGKVYFNPKNREAIFAPLLFVCCLVNLI